MIEKADIPYVKEAVAECQKALDWCHDLKELTVWLTRLEDQKRVLDIAEAI